MRDVNDILVDDDASPEELERLKRILAEDPQSRAFLRRWRSLEHLLSTQIDEALPDRHLLILEGIRRARGASHLSADELDRLSASPVEHVLERHPGLEDVVADVARDADLFDRAWSEALAPPAAGRRNGYAAGRPARPRRNVALRWGWRIGAGVAVAVFAVVALFLVQRESDLTTITVGPNEVREVKLADGSAVRLLPGAELSYHAPDSRTGFNRYVRLTGDAYFEIQTDREGFTIDSPTAVLVVLGTKFGVQSDADETRVYLAEGRLAVTARASRSQAVVLEPGQTTSVARDAYPAPPADTDITAALAWTGLLVFSETPLSRVVDQVSAATGLQIRLDEQLAAETLTGTLDRNLDPDSLLASIADALGAYVEVAGEERILRIP